MSVLVANAKNMRENLDKHYRDVDTRGIDKILKNATPSRYEQNFSYGSHVGEKIEVAMKAADEALHGHGVESIEGAYVNGYWGNIVAVYVNMGDTYSPTIIFDVLAGKFYVGDWGTWLEWRENNKKYGLGNPEY
jgi:hypothetical protein